MREPRSKDISSAEQRKGECYSPEQSARFVRVVRGGARQVEEARRGVGESHPNQTTAWFAVAEKDMHAGTTRRA